MTAIQLTVFDNAEKWIKENLYYMSSDNVCAVRPVNAVSNVDKDNPVLTNKHFPIQYEDIEEGTRKTCSLDDHVKALQLLCQDIGRSLFVGGIKSPFELQDPGNWDIEVVDAYWQLVYYGKVLYG